MPRLFILLLHLIIARIMVIILFYFILPEVVILHSVNCLYQFYRTVRNL